jgi:hypothetical protein
MTILVRVISAFIGCEAVQVDKIVFSQNSGGFECFVLSPAKPSVDDANENVTGSDSQAV